MLGNWVESALDKNYWRALVNAALNLRVTQAMELVMVGSLWKRNWVDSAQDRDDWRTLVNGTLNLRVP